MAADIREKIIAEALHEINRRGADFHMDDLARNLRISKRTLYEHFSSKQEIIEKSMLSLIDDIHEQHVALLANTEMTTEEKIINFFNVKTHYISVLSVRKTDEILRKMPEVCAALEERHRMDWALLSQLFEQAQQEDSFKEVDKFLLIHMLHSASDDILEYFDESEHESSFSEYMEKCIRVILYGIKRQEASNE